MEFNNAAGAPFLIIKALICAPDKAFKSSMEAKFKLETSICLGGAGMVVLVLVLTTEGAVMPVELAIC